MQRIVFTAFLAFGLSLCDFSIKGKLDPNGFNVELERVTASIYDQSGRIVEQSELFHTGVFMLFTQEQGKFKLVLSATTGLHFSPSHYDIDTSSLAENETLPSFNFKLLGVKFGLKVMLESNGISIPYTFPTAVCEEGKEGRIEVKTDSEGVAYFEDLKPGKHKFTLCGNSKHSIVRGETTCEISLNSEKCSNNLSYGEFEIKGKIEGISTTPEDLEIFLDSKNKNVVCKLSGKNFEFVCSNMSFGTFTPRILSKSFTFLASPKAIEVKDTSSITLKAVQTFELFVEGPEGTKIFINNKEETILKKSPFEKKGLQPQQLTLSAEHASYEFSDISLSLNQGSASLISVKLVPSKLALCGMLHEIDTADVLIHSGSKHVTTVKTQNGQFCAKLAPGNYEVEVLDPKRSVTERKSIALVDTAINNLDFKPKKISAIVELAFVQEASSQDNKAFEEKLENLRSNTVLRVLSLSGELLKELRFDSQGRTRVQDIKDTHVRLVIENSAFCFEEPAKDLDIHTGSVKFVQKGYIFPLTSDQPLKLIISSQNQKNHDLEIRPSDSNVCIPIAKGVIRPDGCQQTEPKSIQFSLPFDKKNHFTLKGLSLKGKVAIKGDANFAKRVAAGLEIVGQKVENFKTAVEGSSVVFSFDFSGKNEFGGSLNIRDKSSKWFILRNKNLKSEITDCSDVSLNAIAKQAFIVKGSFPLALEKFQIEGAGELISGSGSSFESGVLESVDDIRPTVKSIGYVVTESGRSKDAEGNLLLQFAVQKIYIARIVFTDSANNIFTKEPIKVQVIQVHPNGDKSSIHIVDKGELIFEVEKTDYYLTPIMREHSSAPSKAFFSASGNKDEHLSFVVTRTGYSFKGQVSHSFGELPKGLFLEATGVEKRVKTEFDQILENGEFRIRNLKPNKEYVISLRANEGIAMYPPSISVKMGNEDQSTKFVLVKKLSQASIKGSVDLSDLGIPEKRKATPYRVVLSKRSGETVEVVKELEFFESNDFEFIQATKGEYIVELFFKNLSEPHKSLKVDFVGQTVDLGDSLKPKSSQSFKNEASAGIGSVIFVSLIFLAVGVFSFMQLK